MSFFRSGRRVRREAAEWVARLGGGAGESDHASFRAWYDADPRHAEAYDRMAAIWSASGQLQKPKPGRSDARRRWAPAMVYALAASVLAIAALAFMWRGAAPGGTEPPISFATARGELKEVSLPDGTRVTLDAGSRIELAFSGAERRLFLREGRARFAVAHEARPFIVQAGDDQVVATGTLFDVSLLDDRMSVVLLEGSVEVRQAGRPGQPSVRRLAAGQRLVVRGRGAGTSVPAARGDTSWTSRMLEFDDVPLAEAVAMANRYSSTQIRLGDDRVARLRVTGAYRAGDAEGLARGLAAAFGLELSTENDGQLRLSRRAATR
jgi:transmembrane sensor